MRDSSAGVLLASTAAVFWGTIGVVYRAASMSGVSGEWLIVGRPLAATPFSLLLLAAGRGRLSRWSVAVGLFGLAPLYVSYFLAVGIVGAAVASILLYTAPLWVALLSPLLLDERLGPRAWALIASGFLGVVLVSGGGNGSLNPGGLALGLCSGVSYAFYMVLARLASKKGAQVEEISIHAIPVAAIAVLATLRPGGVPSPSDVPWILYLAIAGTIVPYILHTWALSLVEAYRVSVVSLVEPVAAVALAHVFLGEALTPMQLLGAVLVLSATLASSRISGEAPAL